MKEVTFSPFLQSKLRRLQKKDAKLLQKIRKISNEETIKSSLILQLKND